MFSLSQSNSTLLERYLYKCEEIFYRTRSRVVVGASMQNQFSITWAFWERVFYDVETLYLYKLGYCIS